KKLNNKITNLKEILKQQKYQNKKELEQEIQKLTGKNKYNKKMKPYNLQEIFENEIKVGQCFLGLYEENYRIVKTLEMNPEKNYVKVLVDDESKHKIIKFEKIPKDTEKIKYDFVNGYWGDGEKFYIKRIHFLTEKEIVYYGLTINDKEHEGGCFGGDQTWHHRIFSDDKTEGY
ncbi:1923_t:CDS:1, partial [Gigaspora margarita]